jgi:hypothetical protein
MNSLNQSIEDPIWGVICHLIIPDKLTVIHRLEKCRPVATQPWHPLYINLFGYYSGIALIPTRAMCESFPDDQAHARLAVRARTWPGEFRELFLICIVHNIKQSMKL